MKDFFKNKIICFMSMFVKRIEFKKIYDNDYMIFYYGRCVGSLYYVSNNHFGPEWFISLDGHHQVEVIDAYTILDIKHTDTSDSLILSNITCEKAMSVASHMLKKFN